MPGAAQTNTHSRDDDDEQKKRQRAANSENQSSVWTDSSTRTNERQDFPVLEWAKKQKTKPKYYLRVLPLLIIFDLMIYFNMKKCVVLFNPIFSDGGYSTLNVPKFHPI